MFGMLTVGQQRAQAMHASAQSSGTLLAAVTNPRKQPAKLKSLKPKPKGAKAALP